MRSKLLAVALCAGVMVFPVSAGAAGKPRGEGVAPSKSATGSGAAHPRTATRPGTQRRRVGSSTVLLPTLPRRSVPEAQLDELNRSVSRQGLQRQIEQQNQFEINQLRYRIDRLR